MIVYLTDGREAEIEYGIVVIHKLREVAAKYRLEYPLMMKINGHFEIIPISWIDLERTERGV